MTLQNKKYDIIIFGASGFVGRLVAEYLYTSYGIDHDIHWAMAGRNRHKLERVKNEITEDPLPILVADAKDEAALNALCQQTKVLCSTVGPYTKFGSQVVAACVHNHCHYCDLTGEVPWMRKMIDLHHEEAKINKLKIVHSCGFDSIPSDMGLLYVQETAKEQTGSYCTTVKSGLKLMKGRFSGGTFASIREVLKQADKSDQIKSLLKNPFALNPKESQRNGGSKDLQSVQYDRDFKSWKCPFIMATINSRNVRRALALKGEPYGKGFQYDEFALMGQGVRGWMKAHGQLLQLGLLMSSKPGSLLGKIIDHFAPNPGEGPSREERQNGLWIFDFLGKWEDGKQLFIRMKGDMDPGYGSTSKMIGESAVCLAREEGPDHYGVLTPSVAMGNTLLDRLQKNAGIQFSINK